MRQVAYDISDVVTWLCWGVMGLTWAIGALSARRRARTRGTRGRAWLAGPMIGALSSAAPHSLWRPLLLVSPWPRLAGAGLLLCATPAAVGVRLSLGDMWSSGAVTKEEHALRTTGPYRYVRHPIYAAILVMVVATALTQGVGRWAATAVAVSAVVAVKIRAEERLLREEFPTEYPRYQREVPALVPLPRRHSKPL